MRGWGGGREAQGGGVEGMKMMALRAATCKAAIQQMQGAVEKGGLGLGGLR